SDGLSDLVDPGEILQIAGSHPPLQAAGQLVDLANARGGHDNITAMVIRMKASAVIAASPDGARRVAKTIPLTTHPTAIDPNLAPGPTGTVLGPPASSPVTPSGPAPLGAPQGALPAPIPAIPSAPRSRPSGPGQRGR